MLNPNSQEEDHLSSLLDSSINISFKAARSNNTSEWLPHPSHPSMDARRILLVPSASDEAPHSAAHPTLPARCPHRPFTKRLRAFP
jgi:hypothetical protein